MRRLRAGPVASWGGVSSLIANSLRALGSSTSSSPPPHAAASPPTPLNPLQRNLLAATRRQRLRQPRRSLASSAPTTPSKMASVTAQSPALVLDPPFVPVPGEREAIAASHSSLHNSSSVELVYKCRSCGTVLFESSHLVEGTEPLHHSSGWPTFTASRAALTVRGVSQRLVAGATVSAPPAVAGSPLPLRTMAARGLPVEGDLSMADVGRPSRRSPTATWREKCLRDVNKRADPHYVEGCCPDCGVAVCRVITKRVKIQPMSMLDRDAARPRDDSGKRDLTNSVEKGAIARPQKTAAVEVVYLTTASAVEARLAPRNV